VEHPAADPLLERIDILEQKLHELAARESVAGPAGVPGAAGPAGPAGPAGQNAATDYGLLADKVARRLPPVVLEIHKAGTVTRQEKQLGQPIKIIERQTNGRS
jgi:hypothetical protein